MASSRHVNYQACPARSLLLPWVLAFARLSGRFGSSYRLLPCVLVLALAVHQGCGEEPQQRHVHSISDEQAVEDARRILEEVLPTVHPGDLEVSLWASEELLGDPVAIHMDDWGRMWASITDRRRTAERDIRNHRDWMIESLTWNTVEQHKEFLHRELAPEHSERNSKWLPDYNEDGSHDWRDLAVHEESAYRLEDLTGNGYANRATEFYRGFNDEISDIAGAILYHGGDLFLGVAPDMWRIRDTSGDGFGDVKESISHGYGVHIGFGGHNMSGLTTGPDGRLYWGVGDIGLNVVDRQGRRWANPRSGAIVRSEPDGSDFEIYATGLRNTHEFTFDKHGNLITVDNDGDHPGEFERLVYLVNGSDSGWRTNWQFGKFVDPKNNAYNPLMDEGYFKPRFDDQAAHILPPLARYHSGPAGMAYNPGTALGENWEDHFFVASFRGGAANSAVFAFTLEESGASFQLEGDRQILEGILPVGMDFGPGGALYVVDWMSGWVTGDNGRIWKIDTPEQAGSPDREDTRRLLAKDISERSGEELLRLLEHRDMRVRQKAQFEIANRGEAGLLEQALGQRGHQLARVHAVWGLAQIGRGNPEAVEPLTGYLGDEDPEIRAQAAKMLGDVRYGPAGEALIPLLNDENARVRFFATEALGRIAHRPALEPIVKMLRDNDDEDVYLRHGAAIALERIGDEEALAALAGDPSPAVRIGAVVALKRMESAGVARFLEDDDEFIVTNAARAINDDAFIGEALPELARMLDQQRVVNEPLLRRAINANLYEGSAAGAERLARFALRTVMSDTLRIESLNTLSVWSEPSVLDRVTGDPRGQVLNETDYARRALDPAVDRLLQDESDAIKIAALETAAALHYTAANSDIAGLAAGDPSHQVRTAALNALNGLEYGGIEEAVQTALCDNEPTVRMNALKLTAGLDLPEENLAGLIASVLENGTVGDRRSALGILAEIDHPASYELLDRQIDLLEIGELDPKLQLDLILAVESLSSQPLHKRLERYESGKPAADPLAGYREALKGGDPERGSSIFNQHEGAQCTRCHAVGDSANDVGPDLAGVGERLSREELLQAMVDPDARIAPGYGVVTLVLQDGETVRGVLRAEDEMHLTLARGDEQVSIVKSDIATRTSSPSGMPAMGDVLSRSELRDLVEYMSTLRNGK